jgi:hypothetical protein
MTQPYSSSEKITIGSIAAACFLLHLVTNLTGAYGFFRDELYYIACSDHLAWGYVDQPPFSLYVLKLSRMIFGDSLTAIRLVPSLAHTGVIVLTGMMVKEMGGRVFAMFIACLAVFMSPIHLGMNLIYSMNGLDIFIWALATYMIVRMKNTQRQQDWIWLGVVLGIGLLNKISVLFLGCGIFAGLLLTNPKSLTTRWPYLAGVIAFIIFLPYIFWNMANDYAHLEFIHNASAGKYAGRSRLDFIKEQILFLNPISLPLWLAGLFALLFYKPLQPYRILGWIYVTAFTILVINSTSKGEYLTPAYAMLFAGAGIWMEQTFNSVAVRWIKYVYPPLIVMMGSVLIPMVLPVLPVERYVQYAEALGFKPASSENKKLSELPQFYADMFGWEEKARDVAKVYNALPPEDKARACIFSNNYGRCGAIDFFGQQYGLPKSMGEHNNYWLWGPGSCNGEVIIILGGSMEDHINDYASCEEVAVSTCTYCMPYENDVKIFVGRGLKHDIHEAWKDIKNYE